MAARDGRPRITSETPGPGLGLLAICSAAASATVAGGAIIYQFRHRRSDQNVTLDINWHAFLVGGLLVCIAQSVVTFVLVQNGLGYQVEDMTPEKAKLFQKLEYSNNLLYVLSLLLLKGVQFLLQFAVTFPTPNYYIPGFAMAGMFGFLFAAAFGCSSPYWDTRTGKCFNEVAFWMAFGIYDVLTDAYSISVVMLVSSRLQLNTSSKFKLMFIMSAKFLPAGCAIARLPFLHGAIHGRNYTIEAYKLAIPTQLQLHLSVVALSLGKVFRFLNLLDVGYLSSAIEPTRGKGTMRSKASSYVFSTKLSGSSSRSHAKNASLTDSSQHLVPDDYGRTITEVEAVPMKSMAPRRSLSRKRGTERELDQGQITVTKAVEIRSEPNLRHIVKPDD